jgi:hypothetical protein
MTFRRGATQVEYESQTIGGLEVETQAYGIFAIPVSHRVGFRRHP